MLDPLSRANEGGIQDRVVAVLLNDFAAFVHEAFHCLAGLAGWLLTQPLENLFEAVDMPLGLFEVILKSAFQKPKLSSPFSAAPSPADFRRYRGLSTRRYTGLSKNPCS
jgi:hypothetical protein